MDIKDVLEKSKKVKMLKANPQAKEVADVVISENLTPVVKEIREEMKGNHQQVMEKMEKPEVQRIKLENDTNELAVQFFSMLRGPKGETGYAPEKGKDYFTDKEIKEFKKDVTPIKNKDYFDGKDGKDGKNGINGKDGKDGKSGKNGIDGKDGKDGVNGKDGSADTAEQIASKINTLEEKINITTIKGLSSQLTNIQRSSKQTHGGGATYFTQLKDVPSSYSGQASKVVSVKADESGLEFSEGGSGSGSVTEFSFTDANGIAGVVTNATSTPNLTLSLGAITPTTVNGLTISNTNGTLTLSNGSSLITSGGHSITFTSTGATNVTLPTSGTLLTTTGSGANLTNVVNSITGTANQVIASAATGAVTLSLPQNVHTAATPQFARLGLGQAAAATDILSITQAAVTSGTSEGIVLISGAHTGLTASTENMDVDLRINRTVQWATGALATQRFVFIAQPTIAFVGASTVTDAATMAIAGPPVQGTNATLTNTDTLWIQAGRIRMEDHIRFVTAVAATSTFYSIGRATSTAMALNVPSGATILMAINGAVEYTFSASSLDMANNDIRWSSNGSVSATQVQIVRINGVLVINHPSTVTGLISNRVNGVARFDIGDPGVAITPAVATTGSPTAFRLTCAAHTTLTASTEASEMIVTAATVQFSTGALTNQRMIQISAPTYGFVGASTLTNAATFYIAGAPIAGTNATITNSYSIWVDAGVSRFDGAIDLSNISAGSTNMIITATSDTPTVTWGAAAGNEASTTPAGYIEITVGGNTRYIPFWA